MASKLAEQMCVSLTRLAQSVLVARSISVSCLLVDSPDPSEATYKVAGRQATLPIHPIHFSCCIASLHWFRGGRVATIGPVHSAYNPFF
jgi:hypothetical protein